MAIDNISNQKTIEQIISQTESNTSNRKIGELGKDDFLNLLVTQLRYQDPLQPVDDKEFIAQMAQFSSLEQMQNMNGSITQSQAYSLIGKHVTAKLIDEKTKAATVVTGDVTGVKVESGKTYVKVNNRDVPIERVTEVVEGTRSSQSNILAYANLVGKHADGAVYDPETGDIIAVSGTIGSIKKGLYEDYVGLDGVQAFVSGILTDEQSTDPNFRIDYLTNNKGQMVNVEITDQKGSFVAVRGLLRDFTVARDGTITATFDQINIPIESITNLDKGSKEELSTYTNLIGYNVTGSVHDPRYQNNVTVNGIVKSVEAGQYENYLIVDGADVEVTDVITDKADADTDYKKSWLTQNTGNNVIVTIRDKATGKRVTVEAILRSTGVDIDGNITAILDQLKVPAGSVSDIKPVT